jgi:hypothetical protein
VIPLLLADTVRVLLGTYRIPPPELCFPVAAKIKIGMNLLGLFSDKAAENDPLRLWLGLESIDADECYLVVNGDSRIDPSVQSFDCYLLTEDEFLASVYESF